MQTINRIMKLQSNQWRRWILSALFSAGLAFFNFILVQSLVAADAPAAGMTPLIIKLPPPAFKGTPVDIPTNSYTEPYPDPDKPRAPIMVPAGLKNVAAGAKVTSSDKNATPDMLAKIIDGDKEANEQSIVYLRRGSQWVELDFGSPQEIFAVVVWHAHNTAKVYHAVIFQLADDEDFTKNVQTFFNNDQENTSGLGVGTDREFFETNEGKLIPVKGLKGRYLRSYTKGSTESALNEYTEIEVYGRPAK
jgi:hypothetical protein